MTITDAEPDGRGTSFGEHLGRAVRPVELVLLTAVPVVLLAVFALPESVQRSYVFDVADPDPVRAFVSHFVHDSRAHLLGNVGIYLVVTPVAYLLFALSSQRDRFWTAATVIVFVFPFTLSLTQLAFATERSTFGFSGVNAAFAGLLCFALINYADQVLFRSVTVEYAPVLLFVVFGVIAALSLPARAPRLELTLLSFSLAALYLAVAVRRAGLPSPRAVAAAVDNPGYVELAGAALALVLAYPYVAFSGGSVPSSGTVDVFVHLVGFALGFIAVYSYAVVIERRRS